MSSDSDRKASKDSDSHSSSTRSSAVSPRSPQSSAKRSRSPERPDCLPSPESPLKRENRKRSSSDIDKGYDEEEVEEVTVHHKRAPSNTLASDICVCQSDPKIPRPRNAFILYRQHHQAGVIAQNRGVTIPDLSRIIGEQWRNQPAEVKNEWKLLAEEEKLRHQQQYPEYRYQPRRHARRDSNADFQISTLTLPRCNKCGRRNLASPTTPTTAGHQRPVLSLPTPSSVVSPNGRYLPMMNGLTLASPDVRHNSRQHPANLAPLLPIRDRADDDRMAPLSPDAKRRRYTNAGAYVPVPARPSPNAQHAASPYRGSFSRATGQPVWSPSSPVMGPPSRPLQPTPRAQPDMSLTLPPLQTVNDQSRTVEAMVMSIPVLHKIKLLAKIAPPLKAPGPASPPRGVRGAIIAVEGDNQGGVHDVVTWLEEFLCRGDEHRVRVAKGPTAPDDGADVELTDYLAVMREWHMKGKEAIEYITTAPRPEKWTSPASNKDETNDPSPIPIVLLNRYQLFASNAYASRIPILDAYSPTDHWQWMATLWRGIVGPDITIYVKDASEAEIAATRSVEVADKEKCIVVRRQKGPGPLPGRLQESALRRLGFEVGECIRAVARADGREKEGAGGRRGS